ncbi:MAG TPA: S1 family peptidase [Solirubrobacterales bacterium]
MQGRSFLVAVLAACAFALGLSSTASAAPASKIGELEIQTYRDDFGVSREVAIDRLRTQRLGATIVESLENAQGSEYAGVWFDNDAGEFVVPMLDPTEAADVPPALARLGLAGAYRTAAAEFSWEELEKIHSGVDDRVLPLVKDRLVQTSLDPRTNSVVVEVAEAATESQQSQVQSLAVWVDGPVEVRAKKIDLFRVAPAACALESKSCSAPLRGGVRIQSAGGVCTAAFKATSMSGDRFVLTAGHCAPGFPGWSATDPFGAGATPIGPTTAAVFPEHDWAAIGANGSAWDTSPWPSQVAVWGVDEQRPITEEGSSFVGEQVCHVGVTTGSNCGTVTGLGKTVPYGNQNKELIGFGLNTTEVQGSSFCVISGDSGGPVLAGNTALGIISQRLPGDVCPNVGYYMEITEAADALGVKVGSPPVETGAASGVTEAQATLNGTVNPGGLSTTYRFEYGETAAYGASAPVPAGSAGSGGSPVAVSATAPNLLPHTRYHFRIVATNANGTSAGRDRTFTTGLKWNLRDSNSSGNPTRSFWFGLPGETKITGDWNGDGIVTPGTYDSQTGVWKLRNANTTGGADITFQYGGSQFKPVTGDWDGNGTTTIGLFEPQKGDWQLRNANSGGNPEIVFQYGGSQFTPMTGDWDGNGTTTIGLFEPQGGNWQLRNANSGGSPQLNFQYGGSQFTPVSGDWDGNGTDTAGLTDPGAPSEIEWNLRNTNVGNDANLSLGFGSSGETRVSGDWNGDGVATIGTYDPATGIWRLRNTNTSGPVDITFQYGGSQFKPVVGDWDGNGTTTIGLYEPTAGSWQLRNANSGGSPQLNFQYGGSQFKPVVGDWDGNGTTTIGLFEPTAGSWQLRNANSGGNPELNFQYGGSQFTPVTGDWDGTGTTTIGLYEESSGSWQLRNKNSGGNPELNFKFGGSGWKPAPGDWDGDGDDTVGVAKGFGASLRWTLRNANSASSPDLGADISLGFGLPGEAKVTGDWNGDGIVTPGTYDPQTGVWKLRNSNSTGGADITFQYGGSQFKPVTGDWDGNGTTTIGLFEPQKGDWQLRNANSGGNPDITFQYGGSQFTPVTGDWDGNGSTTVGLFEPQGGNWQLRNANSGGNPELNFQYGGSQFTPVTGDWDGTGTTTIGLYERSTGVWQLRNKNSGGGPEVEFQFGGTPWSPVTGDWDANGTDTVGLTIH